MLHNFHCEILYPTRIVTISVQSSYDYDEIYSTSVKGQKRIVERGQYVRNKERRA